MANEITVNFSEADAKTIDDLCNSRERLNFGDDPNFALDWLLRTLRVELEKINFEDDATDRTSKEYQRAEALLEELRKNPDWLHPRLAEFLNCYRDTADAPLIAFKHELKKIRANGHAGATIAGRVPSAGGPLLQVSGIFADFVPVMEDSLSDPRLCEALEGALIERLRSIVKECGITHLCFIEKEVGPIGAILMFSAAVTATGLPGCIFRETNWPRRAAIAGARPNETDRVAILYDLVVSGAGIASAAKSLRDLTGAQTAAALVLFRYGEASKILVHDGPAIELESLASGRLQYVSDSSSDAAHIRDVAGEGAMSLHKPTTDAVGGHESRPLKPASTKGDAMRDLRENELGKKPDDVLGKSRQDEILAIKQRWKDARNRTRAEAEAAIEKKVPRPLANLELVERFALEPEQLSKSELKEVKAMLEISPGLRAEVEKVSKHRGQFRERVRNSKG